MINELVLRFHGQYAQSKVVQVPDSRAAAMLDCFDTARTILGWNSHTIEPGGHLDLPCGAYVAWDMREPELLTDYFYRECREVLEFLRATAIAKEVDATALGRALALLEITGCAYWNTKTGDATPERVAKAETVYNNQCLAPDLSTCLLELRAALSRPEQGDGATKPSKREATMQKVLAVVKPLLEREPDIQRKRLIQAVVSAKACQARQAEKHIDYLVADNQIPKTWRGRSLKAKWQYDEGRDSKANR